MHGKHLALLMVLGLVATQAQAIDEKYRKKLEHSGCTQVSEMQGCDINKSKAENAKTGFGSATPAPASSPAAPPGRGFLAKSDSGAAVATIRVQTDGQVFVNGKKVEVKHVGGALHFQQGMITYTLSDKPDGESFWMNTDAGTKGPIIGQ